LLGSEQVLGGRWIVVRFSNRLEHARARPAIVVGARIGVMQELPVKEA
jgi:hypothetical protein